MYEWITYLPPALGGVQPHERRELPGHVTPVHIWPILAFAQGDIPFMAACMGANHHVSYNACWRCAQPGVRMAGLTGVEQVRCVPD